MSNKSENKNPIKRLLTVLKYALLTMFCLTVLLFFTLGYRLFFTPSLGTAYKISRYFLYENHDNMKKVKPIRASELLGGDYDRLCLVSPEFRISELEEMLGRKIGYIEYLSFWIYVNTRDSDSYGTHFLFEKNNKIVWQEASNANLVKPGYDISESDKNVRFGCIKYSELYFAKFTKTSYLDSNYLVFYEK